MIYFFEGARNSGKSYISKIVSDELKIKRYQYDFSFWHNNLNINTHTLNSHLFSMGKETMLLQLIKDKVISSSNIIDRGIFTVMAWAIRENRINKKEAEEHLTLINQRGLLSHNNVTFIHLYGTNPKGRREYKDQWDITEERRDIEIELTEYFINFAKNINPKIKIIDIENKFNEESINNIIKYIKKTIK